MGIVIKRLTGFVVDSHWGIKDIVIKKYKNYHLENIEIVIGE